MSVIILQVISVLFVYQSVTYFDTCVMCIYKLKMSEKLFVNLYHITHFKTYHRYSKQLLLVFFFSFVSSNCILNTCLKTPIECCVFECFTHLKSQSNNYVSRYRFSPRGAYINPVLIRINNRKIKMDVAHITGLHLLLKVTNLKSNT